MSLKKTHQILMRYFESDHSDVSMMAEDVVFADDHAVWEGTFTGRHIDEFAGIPATNRQVEAPLTVIYDVEDGKITAGRIYLLASVVLQQLGVMGEAS